MSESPSLSPSASESPSESPSLSPSASESPSKSPSLSPSASESPSFSPSPSPSASPSESPSPSPSREPIAYESFEIEGPVKFVLENAPPRFYTDHKAITPVKFVLGGDTIHFEFDKLPQFVLEKGRR